MFEQLLKINTPVSSTLHPISITMASIHNLLNPAPELDSPRFLLPSPSPSISTCGTELNLSPHSRKKQKMCKDTAAFVKGNIHGECRYPAYENNSEKLASKHRQHSLRPDGRIMDFARHVPYNSEKKPFLQKTQRDGFEGMFRISNKRFLLTRF